MKMHDIRKQEILKENFLLLMREYSSKVRERVIKEGEKYGYDSPHYKGLLAWRKHVFEWCENMSNEYKKEHKPFIKYHWNAKHLDNVNHDLLIKEILSFSIDIDLSKKISAVFIPTINNKYKIYLFFVNEKEEIIIDRNKEFGRQIITSKINSVLKDMILKNNLILLFNIQDENVDLDKMYYAHLDEDYCPGQIKGYQEYEQENDIYRSIVVPLQRLSVFSVIIVFTLTVIEKYFNINISTQLVLGIGIGFPVAGISFFNLLQEGIPILSENLKYIGKVLVIFGFIVLLYNLFTQVTCFSKLIDIVLNAACPIAIGVWMLKLSSEKIPDKKIPDKIVKATTNHFCDKCIGRGRIESASSISNCDKCSGTGLLGEHIEQQLEQELRIKNIKNIASRRRLIVIFALLYPVILSLFFVISR